MNRVRDLVVNSRAGTVLRLVVGLGIPALLVVRFGAGDVVSALSAIGPMTLAAALTVGVVTTVASSGRWCLVARGVGVELPLRDAVADTYRATLLNSLLPAGVLGDVHRAVRHHRPGDGRGARAVVLERVVGQLVVVAVGVVVLVFEPTLLHALIGPSLGVVAAVVAVVVGAGLVWLRTARRAARWREALVGTGAEIRRGLFTRRTGPGVLALSVTALAGYLTLFVIAARAAGVEAPLRSLLPLVMVALLAMSLPLTVGGWGPREAVAAVAFAAVGLDAGQGLATAVVYGVLALVSCLPGAIVLLLDARGRPNDARVPGSSRIPWSVCSPSSATGSPRPTLAG